MPMPVDFIVGAAVGAALASKPVREAVRKGLIYGVGGALVAYDKVTALGSRANGQQAAPAPEKPAPASHDSTPEAGVQVAPVASSSTAGTPS
jgi:hypothetical protein